ncbi:hypothetical protein CDEF62S_04126 [Castellaniella defragrans]
MPKSSAKAYPTPSRPMLPARMLRNCAVWMSCPIRASGLRHSRQQEIGQRPGTPVLPEQQDGEDGDRHGQLAGRQGKVRSFFYSMIRT